MSKIVRVVAFLICLGFAAPAWAQATRTWISGVGDDVNPCSRTAPCKTWAGAIAKTAAAGEIDALDPGGFGAVTITKSITLDGGPGVAGVLVSSTNGINISAAATDTVILRHLSFDGTAAPGVTSSAGLNGVNIQTAASVHIEDCFIFGFGENGINLAPTGTTALYVDNTVINSNALTTAADADIMVAPNGGSASVFINNSSLTDAENGLVVSGSATVTVNGTVFSHLTVDGISVASGATVNVQRSVISNSATGITSAGTVNISEVMTSDNTTGISGTVNSFANNQLAAGNTTTGTPSSTIPQQ